jgi:glutaryl-CoA dehydrogenase (non-decarboxylating)
MPAAARVTFGVKGQQLPFPAITAAHPNAAADLIMVPMFPGSAILSRSRKIPFRGITSISAEGIEQIAIESKLGLYCAPTGEITFQDAFVPKKNLVGHLGDGFKVCMIMLDNTRLSSASRAVGVGQALIEYSVQYANDRTQFGQPIGKFQMIQDQIADMYIEHEAAKMLVYRSAWEKDKMWRETGKVFKTTLNTSVAKLYAAEAASHAANLAMKIFGSYGFSTEYPVERYYRDSKTYQVVEGTSNIQKVIIAGFALGYRK